MTTLALTQSFTIQTDGVFADTIEGEVVIVNLKNGVYYSLTALAAEIWGHLQERASLGQIVDRLLARYATDRAKAVDWVLGLVAELEAEALIVRAPADAAATVHLPALAPAAGNTMAMMAAPVLTKFTDLREIVLLSAAAYDQLTHFE
jgi:hypothetical protein